MSLPQLKWEDIPKLLESGMDTAIINKYSVNPISSMTSFDCYLGIVTLWYIESIRLTEQQGKYANIVRYPSQTPVLHYSNSDLMIYSSSSKEQLDLAYAEYYSWWQKVKYMDRNEACKIEPLGNSKVHWQWDLSPSTK